jgi:type IV secretory pathway VirB4 component
MEKLHSKKITSKTTTASTQKYLDVAEIKEDVIILKSGALRAVLAVSAINFDLKSTEEQEAVINQYQNFLNSIDFPVQILVSSRKLNMQNYLDFLTDKEKEQKNELLRMQVMEYKNFINQLVSVTNIMEKFFYVVIPFSPIENKKGGFAENIFSLISPRRNVLEKKENFEVYRSQLFQRVNHIIAALSGIGMKIIPLKTEELIELAFNSYNPEIFNATELKNVEKIELSE